MDGNSTRIGTIMGTYTQEAQSRQSRRVLQIRRTADCCRARASTVAGTGPRLGPLRRVSAGPGNALSGGAATGFQGAPSGKSVPNKLGFARHTLRATQ